MQARDVSIAIGHAPSTPRGTVDNVWTGRELMTLRRIDQKKSKDRQYTHQPNRKPLKVRTPTTAERHAALLKCTIECEYVLRESRRLASANRPSLQGSGRAQHQQPAEHAGVNLPPKALRAQSLRNHFFQAESLGAR